MRSCTDRRETLWLDVYGELAPEERQDWERHLETCRSCRKERQRLLLLLQNVKEAMPPPALSPETAKSLRRSISAALNGSRKRLGWRKQLFGIPVMPVHAVAAASLLIVALAWFGLRELQSPPSVETVTNLDLEEKMMIQNLDVIENMELLEEMEVLQRLVQVVDHRDTML